MFLKKNHLWILIVVCFGSFFFVSLKVASQSNQILVSQGSEEEKLAEAEKLNDQIFELYEQGKYDEAILVARQSLAIRKEVLGENHLLTASSLNNLAFLYYNQGNYKEAESLYFQSLDIRKKLGGKDLDITGLHNLAALYLKQANYKEAERLLLQILTIKKEVLGEKHPDTIQYLNSLASFYSGQANYKEAQRFLLQSLAIHKEISGEKHPDTIQSLNSLARFYISQGNYREAEFLVVESLAIHKEISGEKHLDTATSLNDLATVYHGQKKNNEAEALFLQSLAIRKELLGEKHPATANSIYNLAIFYESQGNYEKAEPLYLQSLAIRKEVSGEKALATVTFLNQFAHFYQVQGKYKEAEPLYLQSLAIRKELLGEKHPATAGSLNSIATLYKNQGKYKEAETFFLQSLAIIKELLGDQHPATADSLGNLSILSWEEDKYSLALDYLTQATDIEEYNLTEFLNNIGDESRKQAYINQLSGSTNVTISLHLNAQPDNPEASQLALTTILRRKGRVLDALSNIVAVLRQNSNPQTEALFTNLAQKHSQLSSLTYQGIENRPPEVYKNLITSLEREIKDIETNLSNQSAEFRTINQPITLEAVQKAIPKDTALVEYMVYIPRNPKNRELGKPRYAVYVLHPDGTHQGIDLGETEKIDSLTLKFRNRLSEGSPSSLNDLQKTAQELYNVVFEPLLPLLKGKTNLFISPDSQLNLIPFVALQNRQGKYLLEDYSINYLSSGRDLLRLKNEFKPQSPPVIVANPTYDLDIDKSLMASNSLNNRGGKRALDLDDLICCDALPGTKAEAQAIIPLLSNPLVYTESQALVENVMKTKAPKILHLATHGFFLPDVERETPSGFGDSFNNLPINVSSENPLLRSGLAFAGFNPNNNKMNGILTALDASSLYLWGTKLVVLSACQTGLGDVRNGEGVFGLRRGFVLAGAQSQLMSLWSVDDEGTKELMSNYYQKLNQGEGRSNALRQVQLKMLNSEKYQNPFYWGAFIPSGDWRSLD